MTGALHCRVDGLCSSRPVEDAVSVSVPTPAPNKGLVAPREARNLGIESNLMKWVVVPQWVRTAGASPTGPKPRQPVWSAVHVHTQQWAYDAGRNENAGRVMEPRNG